LSNEPAESLDRYVLLDAQDWMDDAALNGLWREITRTARPGARVIFRTAGEESILPGRVPNAVLEQWNYEVARSAEIHAKDRSAIYGGFHLYVKAG
jgi:S-adenosylmethionine-diacylglycerol 3-amino-3-carboxypropyl transferase